MNTNNHNNMTNNINMFSMHKNNVYFNSTSKLTRGKENYNNRSSNSKSNSKDKRKNKNSQLKYFDNFDQQDNKHKIGYSNGQNNNQKGNSNISNTNTNNQCNVQNNDSIIILGDSYIQGEQQIINFKNNSNNFRKNSKNSFNNKSFNNNSKSKSKEKKDYSNSPMNNINNNDSNNNLQPNNNNYNNNNSNLYKNKFKLFFKVKTNKYEPESYLSSKRILKEMKYREKFSEIKRIDIIKRHNKIIDRNIMDDNKKNDMYVLNKLKFSVLNESNFRKNNLSVIL